MKPNTSRPTLFHLLSGAAIVASLFGCMVGEPDDGGDAQCEAYPACQPGYTEVEECPQDASCITASICGYSILCQDTATCAAVPVCPPNAIEVESCAKDTSCTEVSACGATIFCQEDAVQCTAAPVCPPNTIEVESCPQDASCTTASICGQTLICQEDQISNCLAYPSCQPGTTEVEVCPQDASCVTETLCGQSIICQEDANECVQPVCPGGTVEVFGALAEGCAQNPSCQIIDPLCDLYASVACMTDEIACPAVLPDCPEGTFYQDVPQDECTPENNCQLVSDCGGTATCFDDFPVQCLAYPTCPSGSTELAPNQTCGINSYCFEESLCGATITCEIEPAVCEAVPTCQPGEVAVTECTKPGCYRQITCGDFVFCEPDAISTCQAFPSCPADATELGPNESCGFTSECFDVSLCGYTITCERSL